jgi:hypothetical protein
LLARGDQALEPAAHVRQVFDPRLDERQLALREQTRFPATPAVLQLEQVLNLRQREPELLRTLDEADPGGDRCAACPARRAGRAAGRSGWFPR